MPQQMLLSSIFEIPLFASTARTAGLQKLSQLADFVEEPAEVTSDHAAGVVASIAGSSKYTESFLRGCQGDAGDRAVGRWVRPGERRFGNEAWRYRDRYAGAHEHGC